MKVFFQNIFLLSLLTYPAFAKTGQCTVPEESLLKKFSPAELNEAMQCFWDNKDYTGIVAFYANLLEYRSDSAGIVQAGISRLSSMDASPEYSPLVLLLSGKSSESGLLSALKQAVFKAKQWDLVYRLQKMQPTHLSDEQWAVLFSVLSREQNETLLEISPVPEYQKNILSARLYKAHSDYARALGAVRELGAGGNLTAMLEEADIYFLSNNAVLMREVLQRMEKLGYSGTRAAAEFVFAKGDAVEALRIVEKALQQNYPLHERHIFYAMAKRDSARAGELLLVYHKNGFISDYQKTEIKNEYINQFGILQYKNALLWAEEIYPEVCMERVALHLEYDDLNGFRDARKTCQALPSYREDSILQKAILMEKHSFLVELLAEKVNRNEYETYLLASSLYNTGSYEKAYSVFAELESKNPSLSDDALLMAGKNAFRLQKWDKAAHYMENVYYSEPGFYLYSLLYDGNWEKFSLKVKEIHGSRDELYFLAIHKMAMGEPYGKELRSYLEKPGLFSETAYEMLYVLREGKESREAKILAEIIALAPYGISMAQFPEEKSIPKNLSSIYLYYKALYHKKQGNMAEATAILLELKENPEAELLLGSIDFLLGSKPVSPVELISPYDALR